MMKGTIRQTREFLHYVFSQKLIRCFENFIDQLKSMQSIHLFIFFLIVQSIISIEAITVYFLFEI